MGCARWVWNDALAFCQQEKKYVGFSKLCRRLTQIKKEVTWLNEVSNVVLQQSSKCLDSAYKHFFQGRGQPRFKKKGNRQAITFTKSGFSIRDNKNVYLAKIGEVCPIWSRPLPSAPSSVTVIKDCAGRYFLSFVVEIPCETVKPESPSVGIDLGIKTFATLSDGTKAHSPNYEPWYKRIAQLSKKLARQVRGSKRWERTRLRIAKLHAKIADVRQDFLHKLSTKVMRKNQAVVLEDLNVRGMLKNRRLSKAISRQGWYQFRALCEGKAAKWDRDLRVISRWEATGQHCHKCGHHWGKLDLSTRTVVCDGCKAILDRDENASHNIVQVGMGHRPTLKRTPRECKTGLPAAPAEVSRVPA